jgi:hypothetical protein
MKMIADDMYERYHDENVETEEDFDSMENIDFKHEVIDYAISTEYMGAIEDMINEFGIGKAIFITLGAGMEFQGMDPRQISAILLYQIVMEKLDDFFIYEDYLVYKSEKDEEDGEKSKHYCDVHENEVLLHDGSGGFYCEECDTEDEELNDDTVFVSGIVCKTCKFELPEMKMSEHLDKNNPKNKCKC